LRFLKPTTPTDSEHATIAVVARFSNLTDATYFKLGNSDPLGGKLVDNARRLGITY